MTIYEKAKAYDEALERAKGFIENGDETERTIAESIFAGIMEEPDEESIKKALVHLISEQDGFLTAINGISVKDIISWLEKQGKQKPTDKVKPKFKVGDWVVEPREDEPDYLWYIDRIKDDCYWNDASKAGIKIAYADKECHLWTVEDAKDGDVLAIEWNQDNDVWEKIVIFKHFYQSGIEGYGNTFKNGELAWKDENVPYYSHTWTTALKPATKEQRDLLFKKMKEAGYDWDAEKKELKEIEQKPVDKVKPKFKVGDKVNRNDREDEEYYILTIAYVDIDEHYYICDQDSVIDFEEQDLWHIVEQKPVEEVDLVTKLKHKLDNMSKEELEEKWKALEECQDVGPTVEEFLSSKSSEWSEEDENMFKSILNDIETIRNNATVEQYIDVCNNKIDWFKSLKDKIGLSIDEKSIPSKEFVLNVWMLGNEWKDITKGVCSTEHGTQLDYVLKHWKEGEYYEKIKSQSHWKPSGEQMETLGRYVRCTVKDDHEHLEAIYNQLKKLV